MKSFKLIMLVASLAIIVSSCGPAYYTVSKQQDYENTFVGATYNDIVRSLGAPQRTMSDGANGSILIYESNLTQSSTDSKAVAYNYNSFNGTYTPGVRSSTTSQTYTSYLNLYINSNSRCYAVKTNHTKQVVNQKAMNRGKKFLFGYLGALAITTIIALSAS